MPSSIVPSLDNPNASFPEKLKGKWTLVLLEEGTCCYRAGESFAKDAFEDYPDILEVPSFNEAANLAQTSNHILLIPHIHRIIGEIEADVRWESMGNFIFRLNNPPLHLASNPTSNSDTTDSCACIEPLKSLIKMEKDGIKNWITTETTQQAARVCASGEAEYCVTNEYGLKKYGLKSVRELKKMEICWHPYQAIKYN